MGWDGDGEFESLLCQPLPAKQDGVRIPQSRTTETGLPVDYSTDGLNYVGSIINN